MLINSVSMIWTDNNSLRFFTDLTFSLVKIWSLFRHFFCLILVFCDIIFKLYSSDIFSVQFFISSNIIAFSSNMLKCQMLMLFPVPDMVFAFPNICRLYVYERTFLLSSLLDNVCNKDEHGHHWFRKLFVVCSASNHYLNQWWLIQGSFFVYSAAYHW